MKMRMVFKFRDGRPNETHDYKTKKDCDVQFDNVLRHRRDEIAIVWIGPVNKGLEKVKLASTEEIRARFNR
jgi:predicted aminopeptidase